MTAITGPEERNLLTPGEMASLSAVRPTPYLDEADDARDTSWALPEAVEPSVFTRDWWDARGWAIPAWIEED